MGPRVPPITMIEYWGLQPTDNELSAPSNYNDGVIMMCPLALLINLIEYWGPKATFHWPLDPTNQWGFELIDYGQLL
ncbi:Hypothetical protein FKW44_013163, partial [Caligus rogercresseyi]